MREAELPTNFCNGYLTFHAKDPTFHPAFLKINNNRHQIVVSCFLLSLWDQRELAVT
jgi:hypothetical protein